MAKRSVLMTQKKTQRTISAYKRFPIIITGSVQNKENGDVLRPKISKVTTGMERDEEKEHHLQEAIESQKSVLMGDNVTSTVIPIPKVESLDSKAMTYYNELHRKKLILNHDINSGLDDSNSYIMREDAYDLDEEDARWLMAVVQNRVTITREELESAMEALENASRGKILSFAAFRHKRSKLDGKKLILIYDYWLEKRRRVCSVFPSASLIPVVPDDNVYDDKDPYVAFRKRDMMVRRRSARIANSSTVNDRANKHLKIDEDEAKMKKAEDLMNLAYQFNVNSELDGDFNFQRNRYCTYRSPLPLPVDRNLSN